MDLFSKCSYPKYTPGPQTWTMASTRGRSKRSQETVHPLCLSNRYDALSIIDPRDAQTDASPAADGGLASLSPVADDDLTRPSVISSRGVAAAAISGGSPAPAPAYAAQPVKDDDMVSPSCMLARSLHRLPTAVPTAVSPCQRLLSCQRQACQIRSETFRMAYLDGPSMAGSISRVRSPPSRLTEQRSRVV